MSKYLRNLQQVEAFPASCSITGITISLNIPKIPNLIMEYLSPLSYPSNAKAIASLSFKDKSLLPIEVLAGSALTLLNHYEMKEDKLTATECNYLLSECSAFTLHRLLSLFISYSSSRLARMPHFSFESLITSSALQDTMYKNVKIQDSIIAYIEACEYKEPPAANEAISTSSKLPVNKKEKAKLFTSEQRKLYKSLLAAITSKSLFNSKILGLLTIISQKDNIITLSASIRTKLIDKLEASEDNDVLYLADLIASFSLEDTEIQASNEFAPTVRKTLKEILAEKTAQQTAKLEALFIGTAEGETLKPINSIEANEQDEQEQEGEDDEFACGNASQLGEDDEF